MTISQTHLPHEGKKDIFPMTEVLNEQLSFTFLKEFLNFFLRKYAT